MADDVVVRFVGDDRNLTQSLQRVDGEVRKQQKSVVKLETEYTKLGVAATAISVGIGAIATQATRTGIEFERLRTALETSLGSRSQADAAFQRILDFASATPFQVQEITQAFVQLQNRGITPTEDVLRNLGDIAASQSKSLSQITEAILDASQGEFERLKEFGIRASSAGDQVTIAFKEANQSVENTPEAITAAILALGELEGVAGGMEAQARTLGGSFSNLQDNVDQASLVFFEFADGAIKSVVQAANGLIQSFLEAPPVVQNLIISSGLLVGALSAATAALVAYKLANVGATIEAVKLTASTIAATAAQKAKAAATLATAAATGTLTVAQQAAIASTGLLLARLALFVAALESIRQAYNAVQPGGQEFAESSNRIRESLIELEQQVGSTARVITDEFEPARASWTDFFGFQAQKNITDTRIESANFTEQVINTIDAITALGDSAEDTATKQRLLDTAQGEVNKRIEELSESSLGTEAYREIRGELETSNLLLDQYRDALGLASSAEEAAAAAKEQSRLETEKQTSAIEQQIQALEDAEDVRDRDLQRQREDESVELQRQRQREDEQRQETFQATLSERRERDAEQLAEIQERQQDELQAEQRAFDQRRLQERRQLEDAERAEAVAFEERISTIKEQATLREAQIEEQQQERLQADQASFVEEIEDLKEVRADERREADRAFQDEIDQRLQAQAQSFSEAGRQLSEAEKLAAAESEEERQRIRTQFEEQRRREDEVAALDLADTVPTPEELIQTAKDIAQITQIETAEQAQQLQETLALIEQEQQRQQAEADKAAEAERRAIQQQEDRQFAEELEQRQQQFVLQQEALKDQRQAERQQREVAIEQEIQALEEQRELELLERRRQREDEELERAIAREEELEAKRKENEAEIQALREEQEEQLQAQQEAFNESEREKQESFEDEQRAEQRAFNDEERAKDEALAQRIEALRSQLEATQSAATPDVTEIDAALFKGGPVVPGKTYLGGELNPEPILFKDGSMSMVGAKGPQLFTVKKEGMVFPSMQALQSNAPLVAELQAIKAAVSGKASVSGSDTYNIVGAADPVDATIRLQRERMRQVARLGRI